MDTTSDQVCIIGQGYVGLTLTAVVSKSGYDVLGIEKDKQKLALLQEGKTHFDEPGLETTIRTQMRLGTLEFEQSLTAADLGACTAYIIAVGSPLDSENNSPDLSMLQAAISSVADHIEPDDTVIIRSTISIGTARNMADRLAEQSGLTAGDDFYVAQAPERTVQGAALEEIQSLPQIVGGYNERSVDKAEEILNDVSNTLIKVGPLEAAELIKLFDNTYRDINIAIGNAFGEIAASHGLDGHRLIELANAGYDRNQIKKPGAGVGGGCLPKDPYILIESLTDGSQVVDLAQEFIRTARDINEVMPHVTNKIIEETLESAEQNGDVRALVLGMAFKGQPATNDTRNTPAAPIIQTLNEFGMVDAYDPHVEDEKIAALGATSVSVGDSQSLEQLFEDQTYDIFVVANDNPAFRNIDLSCVYDQMSDNPVIVDGWGLYDRKTVSRVGFEYRVVGGSWDKM